MDTGATEEAVFVEAPARLHFGVLDLRGTLGRWFGGIGAAAATPTLLVSARPAKRLEVSGEDADRAFRYARRVLEYHGIREGARLEVHRALPPHVGLGSGTQLALAVARALAELHGVSTETAGLARAAGRTHRSAIGTHAFSGGGLVVEGGRRPDREEIAPLVARVPFPRSWRCVVGIPHTKPGLSGAAERAAFAELPRPPESDVERVAHWVLMGLLPALVDADLERFGEALSAVQMITGRWFAPIQGGIFAPGPTEDLVRAMTAWGAFGVGQSSWGPAVYGVVDGEERARHLARRVRAALGVDGSVYEAPFRTEGARVWRTVGRRRPAHAHS